MQPRQSTNLLRSALLILSGLLISSVLLAQAPHTGGQTVLILPFDNGSRAPGLEWISEAFPEVLGQRLASPSMYVITRDERMYAFERFGIPQMLHPSRATLYRMAEQMDADYVIFGSYNFDGNVFSTSAQALDMKALRLSNPVKSDGPLTSLFDIQNSLAWELLNTMHREPLPSREEFLRSSEPIRLDAFENYIRGILAGSRAEKISRMRAALRISPNYTMALLQLGKLYIENRDYDAAEATLARIPNSAPQGNQATFLLGIAAFYHGDLERADSAFNFLAGRIPLPEVYNNLGVVASRRGRRSALDFYRKAVAADPNDPDYRLNLAIVSCRSGDTAGAARQLREALKHRPNDADAKNLLDAISAANGNSVPTHLPAERMKRTYDEAMYQQAALEIANIAEQKLATADPQTHAAYYVDRGREMLSQGFTTEAQKQFREALRFDPSSAPAHAGLAQALENTDPALAEQEAQASLKLQPTAEAYLVLARRGLARKDATAAVQNIHAALALEPANSAALALKQSIESNSTEPPKP